MKVSTWPPDGLDRRIMERRVHCSLRTDMMEYSGDSFFFFFVILDGMAL